jgi:glycosyltransferase involved in cell wall biosynthesis
LEICGAGTFDLGCPLFFSFRGEPAQSYYILSLTRTHNFWYIDLMRLLFVADGRSPIAQNWIRYFAERGDEVHLASTFACAPDLPLASLHVIPVAFSGSASKGQASTGRPSGRGLGLRSAIRHWLGPLTIRRAGGSLRRLTQELQPDLVHAMRVPFEGMLAADGYAGCPLLISIWGNDFTLHAASGGMMPHYTSWAMQVADAVHADCQRDIRLAKQHGFDPSRPTLVAPGNGGVRTDIFHPSVQPAREPVVINPRGFRTYVRNDVFFRSIPLVLARRPDARFLCVAMAGERQAEQWVRELGIQDAVQLLPSLPHAAMADLFRRSQLVASISIHDGTPNSLLEAIACGCLPVAGDLDSIREWIKPGRNGLLVDANDPASVAAGLLEGLENESLRHQAAGENLNIIRERAEYARCMAAVVRFYERIIAAR